MNIEADRDLLDWSGKKALEYQKQMTSVSDSTFSSEYERKVSKHEKFFTLPSKTFSPLARGGTLIRRKRRQRPSTTDQITLRGFIESFPHPPAGPRAPSYRAADTNNNSPGSSSTIAKTKPTDATGAGGSSAAPELDRRNRSHQSFFRKKRNLCHQLAMAFYLLRQPVRATITFSIFFIDHLVLTHRLSAGPLRDETKRAGLVKIKARKKHSEKDSGFLRIGSLNVRVKKTTEAFSNFLGVGTNQTRMPQTAIRSSAPPDALFIDKLHKTWGSADNIQKEDSTMPPPKYGPVKKRRQKRDIAYDPNNDHFSQSVPTTPSQIRAPVGPLSENPDGESMGDSDSDTACGFDSNWRPTYI
uniref:Uncharacterized protein n=1 Tax=Anopheles farauti TaxID=69004 RepID=A0A182QU79_9DIPT